MEIHYCRECKHSRSGTIGFQCALTKYVDLAGVTKMDFCDVVRNENTCADYKEKTGHTTTIVVFASFAAFCGALYLAI